MRRLNVPNTACIDEFGRIASGINAARYSSIWPLSTTAPLNRTGADWAIASLQPLGKKRQISPGKLPVDRNTADRLLWQFKQLRKSRAINEERRFARDRV